MTPLTRTSHDIRLFATIATLVIVAVGLSRLATRLPWTSTAETPKRFLGLDEPVEPMRR